jgi:ABC-2 type transport system permease protein
MSLRRSLVIARLNALIIAVDPWPMVTLLAMPLVLMAFLEPVDRSLLAGQGYVGVNGSEVAVPGMAVMFAFFWMMFAGTGFFREHGWGTWDRLRASPARPAEIMVGKCLPILVLMLAQMAVLGAAGALLFGLRVRGSMTALVLLVVVFVGALLALAMALVSVCHTLNQTMVATNLGAIVLSGLGGSFAPVALLPAWARAAAPVSPAYWALRGSKAVILDGGGLAQVALPIAVLCAFAAFGVAVTAARFRFGEVKIADT